MKIHIIFIFICINFVVSQYDSNEILSINVDGLLMKEASITASSTCGMNGPEKFCRLVDEGLAIGDPGPEAVMCDICDDKKEGKRHPIEYAKSDDQNLWWQSPSMAQGADFQRVNITIDLKQVYQIVYILLKMADSPRPGTWILERSDDGVQYLPWIFFADTPYACYNLFQRHYPKIKLTTFARPTSLGDDEVFCTTYYSQPNSLIAGEIIISLINGRESLLMQSDSGPRSIPLKLINFLSARFIRFRFLKPLTLAADLMTHKGHLEKSIYNRYYYSLRNIEIGGKCICNNHADKCDKVVKDGRTIAKCNCKHNTCGNNCETCCPLYNQKAWRQGAVCEECNCNNKTQICAYNQTVATLQLSMNKFGNMDGGGVCLGCSENTDGINCEKCKMGFYRPWNVRAIEPSPCKLCSCYGIGTIGTCISNGEEIDIQKPGDCICKKGYKGIKCEQCDIGYENQNGACVPCPCSIDGSVESFLYRCSPPCNCKVNVDTNSNCRKCKDHFFNLDRKNPDGCQPCYCFGITDRCASLSLGNIKVQSLVNWKATTLAMGKVAEPRITSLRYPVLDNSLLDVVLDSPSVYYWTAPDLYLGNWLSSYRSVLQYVIKIELETTTSGSQIDSADVIIKCGEGKISHSVSAEETRLQRRVQIPIKVRFWKFVSPSGSTRELTKNEFMSCLVNVRALLIKGKYYSNQMTIGLLNVTLDRLDPLSAMDSTPHIEKCDCPLGVTGLSCESCEVGYRRVNNILVHGRCEQCQCFQHSNSCDPFSGNCKDCLHNTAGQFCDSCEPGYYGDPKSGDANACKKCACPLEDYQLSNMCSTLDPNNFICHECTEKSTGRQCQKCMDGHYGNPLKKIPCQKCKCNDNEESCDGVTGQCRCAFNTIGSNCEVCKHGFFGQPLKRNCQSCNCSSVGSQSMFCNKTSGQCPCKENFHGRKCDTCAPGMYLHKDNCTPCSCEQTGRVVSATFCDSMTGQCLCRDGVAGPLCDRCLPDHYGFPDCQKCQCSKHAISPHCNPHDGRCICGRNVADHKCNSCQDLFYWSNLTDCSPCACGRGSTQARCDTNTGQCSCAAHVTGRACDQCDLNYYGLSSSGCTKCPACTDGKVCNNDGICVCPMNTEGSLCERCADQSWGYNKITGCKKCDCSKYGSSGPSCDRTTGQCTCKSEFGDQKCDKCAPNYFGFPNCRPCTCHQGGIIAQQATSCDINTGACSCKPNVKGDKCDQCKPGTFGFDSTYKAGCYSCFCLGQSKNCSLQSDYRIISNGVFKYQISADNNAFVSGVDQRIIVMSRRQPEQIKWPLSFYRPMFADVTNFLNGPDLSLFYGNVLLEAEIDCQTKTCGRENSQQNEVILESYGGAMELRYMVNYSWSVDQKIVVQMKEDSVHGQWYLTKSNNLVLNKPVDLSQPELMIVARELILYALLNVTKVKVQLYTSTSNPDHIKLNLEPFATHMTKDIIGVPVSGVEKCVCSNITTGLHCENPIHGFYRVPFKIPEYFGNVTVRVGFRIEKCFCNGHSTDCNRATGHCTNCLDNTIGDKCDLCADGFYGDAKNNGTCFRCQCPSKDYNFAKKCSKQPSSSSPFECECRPGYTGKVCDVCQDGYFGNPVKGKECRPCNCNLNGAYLSICDPEGKCFCAGGVEGDKCDQCSDNFAVENRKCKDCMAGCTRDLFLRVNKLNESLGMVKVKALPSNEEIMLKRINISVVLFKKKLGDVARLDQLLEEISNLTNRVRVSKENVTKSLTDANTTRDAYEKALAKINELFKEINETVTGGQHPSVTTEMIKKARALTKEINDLKARFPNIAGVKFQLRMIEQHIAKIDRLRKELDNLIKSGQLNNLKLLIDKTRLADSINKNNLEYLINLTKSLTAFESKMQQYQLIMDLNQKEYNNTLLQKVELQKEILKLNKLLTGFEQKRNNTLQIISEIKMALKNVSKETSSPKTFIIPEEVKEHVKQIVDRSKDLLKNLRKSFTTISRAEDAKQAYSNISKDINDVEGAINSTNRQLEDSRNQLNIDKFTFDIGNISLMHNQLTDTMKGLESEHQNLSDSFDSLNTKRGQLNQRNLDIMQDIPSQNFDVNSFDKNISSIEGQQVTTQNTIDHLNRTLSLFILPKSGAANVTDLEQKVIDLKTQYNGIKEESNSVLASIKDFRENLRKIRERLNRRKIYTELAHGAAAKSPEPIRLDKNCVRHYKTYFLPKSNAFSLEVFLKPQFASEQNLVLFGFDNSGGVNKSFALTIEKSQKIKFSYDYGAGVNELFRDSFILDSSKYSGLSISWNLGKWEMKYRTLDEEVVSKSELISIEKSTISNLYLGPESHIFLGGFPSDELLQKSNLKLGGKFLENLKANYKTKHYKGCLYGVNLLNFDLGLQDFHYVEEDCTNSKSADFVLKQSFTCKIIPTNSAKVDEIRTSLKRQKRQTKTDYNIHFNGHGYVMINTSQVIESTGPCTRVLDKALLIYTKPQSKINPQSFQFVAVFMNEKLDIGFVLGQKNGKFHQALWRGDFSVKMRELNVTQDVIFWKIFEKNNDFEFGVKDVCHPDSLMYLGGIPQSETKLRERLTRLNTPYQSYTGSMKVHVVDKELFRKCSTRFVHKALKNEDQIGNFSFHSILVPADLLFPIVLNHDIFENVLTKGFSMNIDFLNEELKEEITLITIDSGQSKLSLKVSPNHEFTVLLNKETLSLKLPETQKRWGTYFVVVNLQVKPESVEIDLTVNEEKLKMKEFAIKVDTQVTGIEIGQVGVQRSFYVYDIFLGDKLVNFNAPRMGYLPSNVYLKTSPSELSPALPYSLSADGPSSDLRVSTTNGEILQSDVAAPPYTNYRRLYSSSIRASKYNLPSFQSEDYPLDSGWFEGLPSNVITMNGAIIGKYLKDSGNKIALRLISDSEYPELILSITFDSSQTLHLVTMDRKAMLYDPITSWNSTLRVQIINKEWHLIEISASHWSDKGLFVKIDGHTFDFPNGPISFSKPMILEIGGRNGAGSQLYNNGQNRNIKMFTGCLDGLTINDNRVSLNSGVVGTAVSQCSRVLEFLNGGGGEILQTYATVHDPSDIVKLQIGNYNLPKSNKNSLTVELKFKYTGFEQGSLLVTGVGDKYCSVIIIAKKLYLNVYDFKTNTLKSESVDLRSPKWYNMEFMIYHMKNTITLLKVTIEDKPLQIFLSGQETFPPDFLRPDIYLGSHPSLNPRQKRMMTKTDRNFVGCISEISVRVHKAYVPSHFGTSSYIMPGRCSLDNFSYLRQ